MNGYNSQVEIKGIKKIACRLFVWVIGFLEEGITAQRSWARMRWLCLRNKKKAIEAGSHELWDGGYLSQHSLKPAKKQLSNLECMRGDVEKGLDCGVANI